MVKHKSQIPAWLCCFKADNSRYLAKFNDLFLFFFFVIPLQQYFSCLKCLSQAMHHNIMDKAITCTLLADQILTLFTDVFIAKWSIHIHFTNNLWHLNLSFTLLCIQLFHRYGIQVLFTSSHRVFVCLHESQLYFCWLQQHICNGF